MNLESVLPEGMNAEDLIVLMAALTAFVSAFAVWSALLYRDPAARRAELMATQREALRRGLDIVVCLDTSRSMLARGLLIICWSARPRTESVSRLAPQVGHSTMWSADSVRQLPHWRIGVDAPVSMSLPLTQSLPRTTRRVTPPDVRRSITSYCRICAGQIAQGFSAEAVRTPWGRSAR